MTPVEEIQPTTRARFDAEFRPHHRPYVIRGMARDWPVVAAQRASKGVNEALDQLPNTVLGMIEALDTGTPTDIMVAPPDAAGRFFYSADLTGFNFQRQRGSLSQLAHLLRTLANDPAPPGVYAGATAARTHLPGFEERHPFPLVDTGDGATTRIWLGNATQIATHFDLSDNFAVVALGQRRFTLFPPEAVGDLYVGPLDVTLAGQPVSLVDPLAPDLARFPRFAAAQAVAQYADLAPGDAIYIPTLWWHHVAASAPVNMLVNYWHNDAPRGGGFLALVHAIMAIRDQPEPQRAAWRAWFEHMVFSADAPRSADHIPAPARGVTGAPSPERDAHIARFIATVLTQE